MPRVARVDIGNNFYHVINRSVMRLPIFTSNEEYTHFEQIIVDTLKEIDIDIIAYVIMPNHWHLLVHTKQDGDLGLFMHKITNKHTRQVKSNTKTIGTGHLYQGRYKSFIIQNNPYLLSVFRYIERNPVRAKMIKRAEQWRWGSASKRIDKTKKTSLLLADSLVTIPKDYLNWINTAESKIDLENMRKSVNKGVPYGSESWLEQTVKQFGLESTLRNPGRPKKS